MNRILLFLMASLALAGCGPRYVDYFPYHDDGTPKPRVALLPVINASDCCPPWDISQELTGAVRYQAMSEGNLYFLSENDVAAGLERCRNIDFFGRSTAFAQQFCNVDYVVVLELAEHDLVPFRKDGSISPCYPAQTLRCNSVLQTKMRIRIVDVRGESPRVVLQEMFTSNYLVPPEGENIDYSKCPWGSRSYSSTPYAQAHKRLVRDLVSRIECSLW